MKKKKNFDAVGWKSYCSRLWSWDRHRARGWADCAQQALGKRACWACQARAAGGLERAWRAGRAGVRRASVLGRAGLQAHRRWRARGRAAAGRRRRRAAGRWARGRALGARQAGAGRAGRAAWAPGLALGSALGALGPFSIRFDSFFFLSHQMNTVHCKIKFFRKKKIY